VNWKVLGGGAALVVPLLAVLLLNLGRDPHEIRSPLVGKPAPSFALAPLGGGEPIALEQLRGRPVVVNFWATWCLPCLQEHPALQAGARRRGRDVAFLGIVYQDEQAQTQRFLAERGEAYPSLWDPETKTAIAYGVQGVPETYFIDRQGVVVAKYNGPLSPAKLDELIARAGGV
jgi:cytochrome c biogenesis protein CcmG/thiol:disulfide interchange protein DsbE